MDDPSPQPTSLEPRPWSVDWPRAAAAFGGTAVVVAVVTGIPTVLIPNGWFTRMTPIEAYAYPVWLAVSLMSGILVASHWGVTGATCATARSRATGLTGTTLAWLAVGCPVCNKIVIVLLGASGAMTFFAPVQPLLAVASLGVLIAGIAWRWRVLRHGCADTPRRGPLAEARSSR